MTSRPRSEAAEVHQHSWHSRIMPRRIVCCSLPLLTFSVVGSSVSAQWKGTFRCGAQVPRCRDHAGAVHATDLPVHPGLRRPAG